MAQRSRGRGRSSGRKRGYYWDGIQFPATNLGAADVIFVLVDTTALEFMPATLMRIRGSLAHRATTATSNEIFLKLIEIGVSDAQLMTDDHSAIDTHEEDIAQRILWQNVSMQPNAANSGDQAVVHIEIDVKVKLRFSASGKRLLALLAKASNTNRTNLAGNIRCLLGHG